jgi:hypothetical protein
MTRGGQVTSQQTGVTQQSDMQDLALGHWEQESTPSLAPENRSCSKAGRKRGADSR